MVKSPFNRYEHEKYVASHRMDAILRTIDSGKLEDAFDFNNYAPEWYRKECMSDLKNYRKLSLYPIGRDEYRFVKSINARRNEEFSGILSFKTLKRGREYTNSRGDELLLYSRRGNTNVAVASINMNSRTVSFVLDDFIGNKVSDGELAKIISAASFIRARHLYHP